jgi:hypothetical protein
MMHLEFTHGSAMLAAPPVSLQYFFPGLRGGDPSCSHSRLDSCPRLELFNPLLCFDSAPNAYFQRLDQDVAFRKYFVKPSPY